MDSENELYDEFQENSGSESGFGDILFRYLKHWPWFVLSLVVFMTIGYFYVKSQVPQYQIEADILIKDNNQIPNQSVLQQLNLAQPAINLDNELLILKSSSLTKKVVKDLGLQTSYYVKGHLSKRYLYKNTPANVDVLQPSVETYTGEWRVQFVNANEVLFAGKRIPVNQPVKTEAGIIKVTPNLSFFNKQAFYAVFSTLDAAANQYLKGLGVTPANKTSNMLILTSVNEVPQKGQDYLNKLIDEFNNASIDDKNQTISNTLRFINERLGLLADELGKSENNVQQFKSSNGIIDVSTQASLVLNKLSTVDDGIQKIDLQLEVLKSVESFISNPKSTEVTIPSMLGLDDPTLNTLVPQLGQLLLQREGLLRTIPESNPLVGQINDQIIALKQSINKTIPTVRQVLLQSKRQLQSQNRSNEADIKKVPVKERGLLDVMRQQDIKSTLFSFLLQKHEETGLALAATTADSRIINKAFGTGAPIRPVKSTLYAIFFALGLALPLGIIFAKDFFNNTVRRKSDIDEITRVPVLAQIAHAQESEPLIVSAKPRSMVAEQVRGLRTNLQFLLPDEDSKVILFTSSISGEGKSFISLNLGASLASTNKKVIILELDLRKPKLLSTLGLERKEGLSDYLIGKIDYHDIIRPVTQQENFYLIESGTTPPNPAELLMNRRLGELINSLKKEYDYIVIDAPPIGLVTDAQIMSRYVDATFFLVRFNYTAKTHIKLINELYRKKIFKRLNIIFNSIDNSSLGYYNYDYSYYGEEAAKKGFLSSIFNK
ncbi:polysaccharide biosynthesis tyrosine autokinase [Mucilaginibacter robiniae]|uniref:non-specific protein-tyrosine kinase n=1 Tax=Mucilaginibacter robiniae TaxID=2728022 RepID=A0A7L5E980_9SPHI|nr:tyrosine-protein kinase [Mucilaginibacter robiniae]QJD96946.1 polysaccharide biosynthesis tyrosine autokinase [Mucilaginibacter robiniae]